MSPHSAKITPLTSHNDKNNIPTGANKTFENELPGFENDSADDQEEDENRLGPEAGGHAGIFIYALSYPRYLATYLLGYTGDLAT